MSYGIEFPRGLPPRAQVSPTCVHPLWPFPPPPPATPGVGRSPASPVGPAQQANRIARFSRSLPSREQTCPDTASNQIQEGGIPERAEHCQGKQANKQNNNNKNPPQDNLGVARGRAEEDQCTRGCQEGPQSGEAGGTEISGTEGRLGSAGRWACGGRAFQERTAKALWWAWSSVMMGEPLKSTGLVLGGT